MLLRAFSWETSVSDDFSDEYVSKDGFKPGTWGCHEALHMAQYLEHQVDEELIKHPAIVDNPEWRRLARAASDALAELYQSIGSKHFAA